MVNHVNTFQDDDYKFGSVCHADPRVRRKAIDHLLACVDVMDATGSRDLKLWFADGTNYPGQDDLRARQDRLAEALSEVTGPGSSLILATTRPTRTSSSSWRSCCGRDGWARSTSTPGSTPTTT